MLETIDTINTALLEAASEPWVLLVLFLFCAIDSIFPPVPSESLVIGLAAVSALSGTPAIWLVLLSAGSGAVLGDLTAYLLGRRVGTRRFAWMRRPRVARAVERTARAVDRRSASFIITGRFVPVGRVAINLTAGASGMPLRRFAPLCLVAVTAWVTFSVGMGLLGGTWAEDNPLLAVGSAVTLGLVLGTVVDHAVRRFTTGRPRPAYAEERESVSSHP